MKFLRSTLCGGAALLLSLPLVAQTETAPSTGTPPTMEDTTGTETTDEMGTSKTTQTDPAAQGFEKVGEKIATLEFEGTSTSLKEEQKTALTDFAKSQMQTGQSATAYVLASAPSTVSTPVTPATPGVDSAPTTPTGTDNGQKMVDDRVEAVRSALNGIENLTVEVIEDEATSSVTEPTSPTTTTPDSTVTGSTTTDSSVTGSATDTTIAGGTTTDSTTTDSTTTDTTTTDSTTTGGMATDSTTADTTTTTGGTPSATTADPDEALKNQMRSFVEEGKIVVGIGAAAEGLSH